MGKGLLALLRLVLQAWGVATALFLLTRTLPDEQQLLARLAEPSGSATVSAARAQAAQQAVRQRLGLTAPLFYVSPRAVPRTGQALGWRWQWNGPHNQYHRWLRAILRGDLGRSYRTDEPVTALLGSALRSTLPLAGGAVVLIIGLAVPLGLWLAQSRAAPWAVAALSVVDALPLFVVALLLLLLLANPDFLTLFPAYELGDASEGNASGWPHPQFLALPLASLVLTGLTEPALQLAAALRHEARLDYMRTARAKGLSARQALRRHALRNAVLPLLTSLTELLPTLLAGAVVVEWVFALPGLGRLLAEAAAARDYPVLLGSALVVLAARLLTLFLADVFYRWVDPRLRSPVHG